MGVLLSALVTGCYGTNSVFVEPPIDVAPLIEPAQVSVGIYYSEDLRNHKCTADARFDWNFAIIGRPRWTFALGPPSIEMFDILFTALFTDVETRDTGPEITSPGDQRYVIELRLSELNTCEVMSWDTLGPTVIDITYEAIVWSAEGEKIAQWEGRGRAGRDDLGRYYRKWEPLVAALTSVAMRKAAADFIVNFENDPVVRAWLGK